MDQNADRRAAMIRTGLYSGIALFALSIPISFVPAEFGIAIAVLFWILHGLVIGEWLFVRDKAFVIWSAYIGWNVLASLNSPRPVHSLLALPDNEWAALICFLMLWSVTDTRRLATLVRLFLVMSSIAMVYGIWQAFSGVELWRGEVLAPMGRFYRAVGFNGFYLTFAGFAMSVFFLAANLAWELRAEAQKAFRSLGVALLALGAIVGTFARSIWLAVAVLAPVVGFLRNRSLGLIAAGAMITGVVFSVTISDAVRERAASAFDLSQNETRINLWETSLRMSWAFPVLGIGQDNFDYYFEKYKVSGFYDVTVHPHNDYLTVLVSSGIPGLLLWLGLWGTVLVKGFRGFGATKDPFLRGVIGGGTLSIAGFLVGALFQNYYGTFANCLGWWFVAGLLLTAVRIAEISETGDRPPNSVTPREIAP